MSNLTASLSLDGYEVIPYGMTQEELDAADDLVREQPIHSGSRFTQDLTSEHMTTVSSNEKAIARLLELLDGDIEPYFTNLIVTHQGHLPITGNWHQDRAPKNAQYGIKVTYHLTDSLPGEGAVELALRSWNSHLVHGEPDKSLIRTQVGAKRGDILLMRTDLWHRSTRVGMKFPRCTLHASFMKAED